jgi:hypothetical protein
MSPRGKFRAQVGHPTQKLDNYFSSNLPWPKLTIDLAYSQLGLSLAWLKLSLA